MKSTYNYDQVYSYEKILQEIKDLIIPTIISRINSGDIKNTGLSKFALAEDIYSKVMALGYNDRNINAALNDLMPTRNPILYPGPDEIEVANMSMHLVIALEDYKHQIFAFKTFHNLTLELKPYKEVITTVKKHLFALQFE